MFPPVPPAYLLITYHYQGVIYSNLPTTLVYHQLSEELITMMNLSLIICAQTEGSAKVILLQWLSYYQTCVKQACSQSENSALT